MLKETTQKDFFLSSTFLQSKEFCWRFGKILALNLTLPPRSFINHKVPEIHQDMKFWPNLNSFIRIWKITLSRWPSDDLCCDERRGIQCVTKCLFEGLDSQTKIPSSNFWWRSLAQRPCSLFVSRSNARINYCVSR